jgi:MFS superfamily sulfate permease-like transporter
MLVPTEAGVKWRRRLSWKTEKPGTQRMMTANMMETQTETPRGDLGGLFAYTRHDALSGFLVFLIALPLCLGISLASGYPAIAGVFTAIIGGALMPWLSNSELTIKGPAAGLIVIALGAITELGAIYGPERAYRLALGVGVAAGVIQILLGLSRSGILGEFFPTSVVHGMLAAIGVIIMAKQVHITLGVMDVKGDPFQLIAAIPRSIGRLNPEITLIGLVSLLILFILPLIRNRYVRMIPAPLIVVLVAVPLGIYFDLSHEHTYSFGTQSFHLGEEYLVAVPSNLFAAVTVPDFQALSTFTGWKWVALFALIGTLESLLSAKAIDLLDPWRRKTDLNRDLLGVGIGNTLSASIGGLPMISEIVRSKANVDNGAHTRFANMYHGLFLLAFVALLPGMIHRIPLAALSAMLVYTGARLASPREFQNVFRIGKEQFVIFVSTLVGVLATDLLVGVIIGIVVKFAIHLLNGVPVRSLFKPFLEVQARPDGRTVIKAKDSAVFSNWIPFRRQIEQLGLLQHSNLIVDLSETRLVDHSVMEKLHELQEEFEQEGLTLELSGLESHVKLSDHEASARRRGLAWIRRITIVTEAAQRERVVDELIRLGVSGYTAVECTGVGRRQLVHGRGPQAPMVRLEVLVGLDKFEGVIGYLRKQSHSDIPFTVAAERVEVIRPDDF